MAVSFEAIVVKLRETQKSPLDEKEAPILSLLCIGKSTKQIAFELGCSTRYIEIYRQRIMRKTGAKSLVHLGCIAVSRGWV